MSVRYTSNWIQWFIAPIYNCEQSFQAAEAQPTIPNKSSLQGCKLNVVYFNYVQKDGPPHPPQFNGI